MLYNIVILLAVAYSLAFISIRYAVQIDTLKQLQFSRDTLNSIHSYYASKHDQLFNLIISLYIPNENYIVMSNLFESTSDQAYDSDAYIKQDVVRILNEISGKDQDIAAILFRKNTTGAQFIYYSDNRTLQRINDVHPIFERMRTDKRGRMIYGTQELKFSKLPILHVYGLSSSVGSRNQPMEAGNFLFLFKTKEFERVIDKLSGKELGRFFIISTKGEIIFDSKGNYSNPVLPDMESILSDEDIIELEGERYYKQIIKSKNRNFVSVNLIPQVTMGQQTAKFSYWIYGVVTLLVIICAVLYFLAGAIVFKKVKELIRAMKRIGAHNLSYRIPIDTRHGEFSELILHFNAMGDKLEEMIEREYVTELRKKNAELQALQTGINPHFLYNTLEVIRLKASQDGNNEVSEMIVLLAQLFRSIIKENTFIPISSELMLCKMFIEILSMRYGSNFEYLIDVDSEVMNYGIPKNLLQPLVENYFVHGMRSDDEDNHFIIRGKRKKNYITFTIEDNGRGISTDRLFAIEEMLLKSTQTRYGKNYGIQNVNERIQIVYGKPFGILIESEKDNFTRLVLTLGAFTCEELEQKIQNKNYNNVDVV